MKIKLNGKSTVIPDNQSLDELINDLNLKNEPIVAEITGKIIQPEDYKKTVLKENDVVELIRFVGGG